MFDALIDWIIKLIRSLFSSPGREKEKGKEEPLPFRKKDYFFTVAERTFFSVLEPIAQKHNLCVFGKVRMEDLLWLPRMERRKWMHYRGKVRSRHIDFVLCDKEKYRPVLAIELNDSSHNSPKRQKVDRFKSEAFAAAGLSFLPIPYARYYDPAALEQKILEKIN